LFDLKRISYEGVLLDKDSAAIYVRRLRRSK
jgi:hypothetical protein